MIKQETVVEAECKYSSTIATILKVIDKSTVSRVMCDTYVSKLQGEPS